MRRFLASALVLGLAGCVGGDTPRRQPMVLFVGIDISGSFHHQYEDSLEFLSYYLYGHLNGAGNLQPLKSLFVGAIGGKSEDEPKAFHPIQDFQGKQPEQITADLKAWFSGRDQISDFNVFFKQAAHIAQVRNLNLSPISIVLLSDGIPALPGEGGEAHVGRYEEIDLSNLEYLSRKVTVRLLYPSPPTASKWEAVIRRQRVRMWTVDDQVMAGWKGQLTAGIKPEEQQRLWSWISDNIDYRVRPVKIRLSASRR